jgi:hypothetical protein
MTHMAQLPLVVGSLFMLGASLPESTAAALVSLVSLDTLTLSPPAIIAHSISTLKR